MAHGANSGRSVPLGLRGRNFLPKSHRGMRHLALIDRGVNMSHMFPMSVKTSLRYPSIMETGAEDLRVWQSRLRCISCSGEGRVKSRKDPRIEVTCMACLGDGILSGRQASLALGCTRNAFQSWVHGNSKIPRYIGLACSAIMAGMDPYKA